MRDLITEMDWRDTRAAELMSAAQSCDRIVSVHSLTPRIELHVGCGRKIDQPLLTESDVHVLHALIHGFGPLAWRMAVSYGLLETQLKLTKRERETLIHLLSDLSEKEIAAEMGVTANTVHQYVVKTYQKLGISSRPELMSRWMQPFQWNDDLHSIDGSFRAARLKH